MNKIKLLIKYVKDKEVSIFKKLLILGGFLYLIFPMDIIPDFIIGLGLLDDAAVLLFIWNAIKSELSEYEDKIARTHVDESKIIEVDFKKEDDEK